MRDRFSTSRGVIGLLWLALIAFDATAEDSGWRAPAEVPGATTVTVERAKELFDAGVAFIDVRNPRLYARRHVPGAHHLDMKDVFGPDTLSAVVAKDEPLVIYCSGLKCSRSSRASEMAADWGFQKVYYFRGGIVDWRDAGMPLESSK